MACIFIKNLILLYFYNRFYRIWNKLNKKFILNHFFFVFLYDFLTQWLARWTWNREDRGFESWCRWLFILKRRSVVLLYKLSRSRPSSKWEPDEIWVKTGEMSDDLTPTTYWNPGRRQRIRRSVYALRRPLVSIRKVFFVSAAWENLF